MDQQAAPSPHMFSFCADIAVCNGDADGLCALQQLLLAHALASPDIPLITGVKRDIQLLHRVHGEQKRCIMVLDLSLAQNLAALHRLLDAGNRVVYIDHHFAGQIPCHQGLQAHIHPEPNWCAALIVNQLLGGAYAVWAIVGAFGDGLDREAGAQGVALGLHDDQLTQLAEFGRLLNYNSYGLTLADVHVAPAELWREMRDYPDPLLFYRHSALLRKIAAGYRDDMAAVAELAPLQENAHSRVFLLPDAAWTRRMSGMLANRYAQEQPHKAQALVCALPDGAYRVSVRAPRQAPIGAERVCQAFAGGGGRAAAAGINRLPPEDFPQFLSLFSSHFAKGFTG